MYYVTTPSTLNISVKVRLLSSLREGALGEPPEGRGVQGVSPEKRSLDSQGKTTQPFGALRALLPKGLSKQARSPSNISQIIQTSSLLWQPLRQKPSESPRRVRSGPPENQNKSKNQYSASFPNWLVYAASTYYYQPLYWRCESSRIWEAKPLCQCLYPGQWRRTSSAVAVACGTWASKGCLKCMVSKMRQGWWGGIA